METWKENLYSNIRATAKERPNKIRTTTVSLKSVYQQLKYIHAPTIPDPVNTLDQKAMKQYLQH